MRIDRAALFPTIGANGSVSKSGGRAGRLRHRIGNSATTTSGGAQYSIGLGGSWAPDLWGGIRRTIEGARASAQASAGQIANARLSAQSELALDYIQLRQDDEQIRLLNATVVGYQRNVAITQNKYDAGVAAKSDLLSARTQLESAQADAVDYVQQRAKLEHAIALLVGAPPAAVTIAGGLLDAGLAHAAARRPRAPSSSAGRTSPRPNATSPPPTPRSACRRPPTIPASA